MFEPVTLRDVFIDDTAPIKTCDFCGERIWWGLTSHRRRNPFDVQAGERTAVTHWSTCQERAAAQQHFKHAERLRHERR